MHRVPAALLPSPVRWPLCACHEGGGRTQREGGVREGADTRTALALGWPATAHTEDNALPHRRAEPPCGLHGRHAAQCLVAAVPHVAQSKPVGDRAEAKPCATAVDEGVAEPWLPAALPYRQGGDYGCCV